MTWWQVLLFPFAIIYDIVTSCRNWMYDLGIFKAWDFPKVKIISVGNLSVGGTGKTPMVEYLIKKGIQSDKKIAVLSRGYGRDTKGLRLVSQADNASTVGDESFGYFLQFGDKIQIVVAERRVDGIQFIESTFPEIDLVILDDAFQHRSVRPNFSILLTTFNRPFWKDYILPSGLLREGRKGALRADTVIVTKAPEREVLNQEWKFSGIAEMYLSGVKYGEVKMVNGQLDNSDVIAIAGLADNEPFFNCLRESYNVSQCFSFRDHMQYQDSDLHQIVELAKDRNAAILTSFKDFVKLKDIDLLNDVTWGYVPIEVEFLKGEEELNKKLAPYYDTAFETEH